MEAHIQYIAIRSHQPDALAKFYEEYFSLEELARDDNGNVALTDGFYNLSILKAPEDDPDLGYSNIGIHVDDLHELVERIEKFPPTTTKLMWDEGGPFHGEYQLRDPNDLRVAISTSNFGVPPLEGARRLPAIRHIAMSTPNRAQMSSFYQDVFGFRRQVSRGQGTGTGMAGGQNAGASVADGHTAYQFLVYPVTTSDVDPRVTSLGPRHTRFGVNHFGWLVSDLELSIKVLPEDWVSIRPARGMAEWRGLDPDGNEFDLSQEKGYQVDADVWVRS